jgi:2-dehydro-3-deoxy-D-gluconate 5-dehydrogenase
VSQSIFDLAGVVAFVTGGNGGIGRGIALALARAGADVAIAARNADKTRAVMKEIETLGRRAIGVSCDVRERSDLERAVGRCVSELGRLDILVNNAGVAAGGPPQDIDVETWDFVVDTNLKAVFQCSQIAYPSLKAGGRGKVINIGSEYSLFGSATVVPYAASKGGVIQLTKSLAVAWAKDNIQVNAIIPGWITTEMIEPVLRNEAFRQAIVSRTPAGRFGEPEELAGTAVYLASRASDFVTGQSIPVDGGFSIA